MPMQPQRNVMAQFQARPADIQFSQFGVPLPSLTGLDTTGGLPTFTQLSPTELGAFLPPRPGGADLWLIGGCPKLGTKIVALGDGKVTMAVQQNDKWVRIKTANGRTLEATLDHPVYSDEGGRTELQNLKVGQRIVTEGGLSKVTELEHFTENSRKVIVNIEDGHLMWCNGILSHNKMDPFPFS